MRKLTITLSYWAPSEGRSSNRWCFLLPLGLQAPAQHSPILPLFRKAGGRKGGATSLAFPVTTNTQQNGRMKLSPIFLKPSGTSTRPEFHNTTKRFKVT